MTLVGLLIKGLINFDLPSPKDLANYVGQSYALLQELHGAIFNSGEPIYLLRLPPTSSAFHEPIFYSGDSAYHFQYSHFAPLKYKEDADWLLRNKNIDLEIGRAVCQVLRHLHEQRIRDVPCRESHGPNRGQADEMPAH